MKLHYVTRDGLPLFERSNFSGFNALVSSANYPQALSVLCYPVHKYDIPRSCSPWSHSLLVVLSVRFLHAQLFESPRRELT